MTAIAAFAYANHPIVFGDLLLSGDAEKIPKRLAALPTNSAAGEVFPDGSGWALVGMAQKVVCISPQCLLAWCGSHLGARIVVDKLREIAAADQLTARRLMSVLQDDPETRNYDVGFVGAIADGNVVQTFGYPSRSLEYGHKTVVGYFDGSGAEVLKGVLASGALESMSRLGNGPPETLASSIGLFLGSGLLQKELETGPSSASTLLQCFGGGYEVATLGPHGFGKVSDYTYVIWQAWYEKGSLGVRPELLIKQTYINGHLVLKSMQTRLSSSAGEAEMHNPLLAVIPPMYEAPRPQPEEVAAVSLNSRMLCHCFRFFSDQQIEGQFTRVQVDLESQPSMTFEDHGSRWSVHFTQKFVDAVVNSFREKFKGGFPNLR